MENRPIGLIGSHESHGLIRREMMHSLIAMLAPGVYATRAQSTAEPTQQPTATNAAQVTPYDSAILPRGVRSRFISNGNGLRMHVLEAGFGTCDRASCSSMDSLSWHIAGER